jgi:hypothetical protein
MDSENKKFPPPRQRVVDPYRQPAPPPPPLPSTDIAPAPIVRPAVQRDLLEELEKVEVDPQVLAEARSSNRAWGAASIVLGLVLFAFGVAMDETMWSYRSSFRSSRATFLPGFGIMLVAYGVRKWRQRGIDY